ncbi:MAG: hypothetical protein AVDCRST_MAG68-5023, partial [uncultured Gemmatimonadetes bacterium]
ERNAKRRRGGAPDGRRRGPGPGPGRHPGHPGGADGQRHPGRERSHAQGAGALQGVPLRGGGGAPVPDHPALRRLRRLPAGGAQHGRHHRRPQGRRRPRRQHGRAHPLPGHRGRHLPDRGPVAGRGGEGRLHPAARRRAGPRQHGPAGHPAQPAGTGHPRRNGRGGGRRDVLRQLHHPGPRRAAAAGGDGVGLVRHLPELRADGERPVRLQVHRRRRRGRGHQLADARDAGGGRRLRDPRQLGERRHGPLHAAGDGARGRPPRHPAGAARGRRRAGHPRRRRRRDRRRRSLRLLELPGRRGRGAHHHPHLQRVRHDAGGGADGERPLPGDLQQRRRPGRHQLAPGGHPPLGGRVHHPRQRPGRRRHGSLHGAPGVRQQI